MGFTLDGGAIVAGYEDGLLAVTDAETFQPTLKLAGAHDAPISALRVVSENLFAVGDEDGAVRLWDRRGGPSPAYHSGRHTDFITDLALHARDSCLVATSGDGTISVHDLAKRKLRARSEEDADDELLSAVVVKKGKKVVCGTQSGVINLYSWGYFNDCSDRCGARPQAPQRTRSSSTPPPGAAQRRQAAGLLPSPPPPPPQLPARRRGPGASLHARPATRPAPPPPPPALPPARPGSPATPSLWTPSSSLTRTPSSPAPATACCAS